MKTRLCSQGSKNGASNIKFLRNAKYSVPPLYFHVHLTSYRDGAWGRGDQWLSILHAVAVVDL